MWQALIPFVSTLGGIAIERYIHNRRLRGAMEQMLDLIPQKSAREIAEQAIIAANLERANKIAAEIDRQRAKQKQEEAEALARGRADAFPDVEIVDPHEDK